MQVWNGEQHGEDNCCDYARHFIANIGIEASPIWAQCVNMATARSHVQPAIRDRGFIAQAGCVCAIRRGHTGEYLRHRYQLETHRTANSGPGRSSVGRVDEFECALVPRGQPHRRVGNRDHMAVVPGQVHDPAPIEYPSPGAALGTSMVHRTRSGSEPHEFKACSLV